jgi:hypothetical protein
VFYFHRPPTNKANAECTWPLSTNAEFNAVAKMAAKATFTP